MVELPVDGHGGPWSELDVVDWDGPARLAAEVVVNCGVRAAWGLKV